jgi:adenylate cyclase
VAQEIERKYLPAHDGWRGLAPGIMYRQGYLCASPERTVRVRLAGDQAFLTIKGQTQGISRAEFEYVIPLADATALLALCSGPLVEKKRHRIATHGLIWEVDEFYGDNAGLVVIEVELACATQKVVKPDWVGEEVSHDPRYTNAMLSRYPYCSWKKG